MNFSRELRDDVMSGDITVSFRLWQRPQVRVGGRYPVGSGYIEVDAMELMPFSAITPADHQRHPALPGGVPHRGGAVVTGDSSRAAWLRQARSYLRNADPVLARLIDDRPVFDPRAWLAQLPPMDLFGALVFQVTGQQLSVPATRRTLARIQALFGGHLPAPAELLGADPGKLGEAGLSWRKITTLRDLAGRMSDGRLNPDVLSSLPDDELMAELTAIP